MARVKLDVTEVWVLERILPYEGSDILGVFVDPQVAMNTRPGPWRKETDQVEGGDLWTTQPKNPDSKGFYVVSQYPVRRK